MTRAPIRAAIAVMPREELGTRAPDFRGQDELNIHPLHFGRVVPALARAYRNGGVTNHIFTTHKEGDQP